MKKKYWIIGITALICFWISIGISIQSNSVHNAQEQERISWLAPYYNDTKEHTLWSSTTEKLNAKQVKAFYKIAQHAVQSENTDIDFAYLDDTGLFVEKASEKHTYNIHYSCKNPATKEEYETTISVMLKSESLKGKVSFQYSDYESDLDHYTDDYHVYNDDYKALL